MRSRRIVTVVGAVVVLAVVFAAGLWAGRTALAPPQDPLATADPVLYEVKPGSISRELSLSAAASWPVAGTLRSGANGVLTTVDVDSGAPVEDGTRVASIDLAPVFVAQGAVPSFRTLSPGSKGADVTVLQEFLARQGFDPGVVDGSYGTPTASAVRSWQGVTGQAVSGVVEQGRLLVTPELPVRLRFVLGVGDAVAQGADLAELLAAAPAFTVGVTDTQVALVPPDAAVSVQHEGGVWPAQVAGLTTPEPGTTALVLAGADGGVVCGADCDAVPTDQASVWGAEVTLVPQVDGLVVPVSGLRTDPDGNTSVLVAGGEQRPVEVIASADGLAVIEGVPEGTTIRLAGSD